MNMYFSFDISAMQISMVHAVRAVNTPIKNMMTHLVALTFPNDQGVFLKASSLNILLSKSS